MSYDNANEVVNDLFESLPSRYQNGLETSMRDRMILFLTQFNFCIINAKR